MIDHSDWRLAVRSSGSRHVCLSPNHSVPSLFQLATRSVCSGNRCISAGLVSDPRVCQPTLEYDRSGSVPGTDTEGMHCSGGTSVENTTMVPTASENASHIPVPYHTPPTNAESGSTGSRPSTSRVAYLTYIYIYIYRERYQVQELSEEATSLMLKSWRTKTNRSYDSLFGKWHRWCSSRGSDPFSGPVKEVVNFLAQGGYQYRSLNSYRSAISSVHETVDGYAVGQHPLVTRLMRGIFNDRPPVPRYSSTWNVQEVLTHIASWGETESLFPKRLSWKTAMLLLLTRPSRSADLSQLNLMWRRYKPDGVVFAPPRSYVS